MLAERIVRGAAEVVGYTRSGRPVYPISGGDGTADTLAQVRSETIAYHVSAAESAEQAGEPGIAARHRAIAEGLKAEKRREGMPPIYRQPAGASGDPNDPGTGLWGTIRAEGFDLERKRRVAVHFRAVGLVSPTVASDVAPLRVDSPAFGFDQRYLHPVLPTTEVAPTITSVPSFRQTDRTLADPGDMVRDIDDITTKPETDSSFEIAAQDLQQIANVETGIPNVLFRNQLIRDVVEQDLRFGFLDAVDQAVLDAIAAASVPNGTTGADLLAQIRNGMAAVEAAGYNPDTVALSPTDAASLDLLQSSGPELIYQFGAASVAPGVLFRRVRVRTVKGLDDPLVLDSQAAGRLFITAVEFNSFEENAGATNSQTARLEANGAFSVQRPDAIYRIGS